MLWNWDSYVFFTMQILLEWFVPSKFLILRMLEWWLELWSASSLNRKLTKSYFKSLLWTWHRHRNHYFTGTLWCICPYGTKLRQCFINSSMEIYLFLWDEPVVKFKGLLKSGDRTNSVILVTTVIPLKTGGTLYNIT